jgi:hypothetical protein
MRLVRLGFVIALLSLPAAAEWPWTNGTCINSTDLFTCLSCASALYEACYTACPFGESDEAMECDRECVIDYRADLRDCHGNFGPLYL